MITRRRTSPLAPEHQRRCAAFVLIEAALALAVVVLAVWLAVELLGRVRQRQRCETFIADVQSFSAAFERHARQPEPVLAPGNRVGVLPPTLAAQLSETNWAKGSPFGGAYEWVPPAPAAPMPSGSGVAQRGAVPAGTGAPSGSPASGADKAATVTVPDLNPGTGAAAAGANPTDDRGATARSGAARPPTPMAAGTIALTAFPPGQPLAMTRADLLYIDRRIDDGNPATGRFRTGFNGWPVYALGGK